MHVHRPGRGHPGDDQDPPVHADLEQPARVHGADPPWQGAPQQGVQRRRLELAGPAQSPRLTTLVRFAPGARFPPHRHDGGEEYLVLAGTFEGENGAYPAGSYVRNPPGTRHHPGTRDGCTLFVKLRQFAPGDHRPVTALDAFRPGASGLEPTPGQRSLHQHGTEQVLVYTLAAGSALATGPAPAGVELLVLTGELKDQHGLLSPGSWLRLPPGSALSLEAHTPAQVWLKEGHLGPDRFP